MWPIMHHRRKRAKLVIMRFVLILRFFFLFLKTVTVFW